MPMKSLPCCYRSLAFDKGIAVKLISRVLQQLVQNMGGFKRIHEAHHEAPL